MTDNGVQLTSKELQEFMTKRGIKHIRIAPYRPQSNGLAERMVQTVKQSLKACLMSGDDRPARVTIVIIFDEVQEYPAQYDRSGTRRIHDGESHENPTGPTQAKTSRKGAEFPSEADGEREQKIPRV